MEIVRIENTDTPLFQKVVEWSYNWWGEKNGKSLAVVRCFTKHSINKNKLPQTFVAVENGEAMGMYQLSMSDDLFIRPDIYPWLINVYVPPEHRGKKVCRAMMESVPANARSAGINELYLYTHHQGLYEKFGWVFTEEVEKFGEEPSEGIYKLKIK